jgi:hypothetical protein
VIAKQVVPANFAEEGRTYQTTEDFFWPAVLDSIQIDNWEMIAGGNKTYTTPIYSREAYRGPCNATVTEKFYTESPAVSPPETMLPLPMDMQTPEFGLNIGPTLHTANFIYISTGTDHPIYEYTVGTWNFPATSPTDWPASVIGSDIVTPFRGGYLKRTITIYQP